MEEKGKEIEEIVRSLIIKLNITATEEQIQSLVNRLINMEDIKQVIDSLALSVDKFYISPEQTEIFDECMEDLLKFGSGIYKSTEEIIAQLQYNKAINYTPGDMTIEENHKLIKNTIKIVCDKLNELGVDYYVVGALSALIGTQTPLFRYHGDIDFMVAEKDIEKVKKALEGTDYIFQDDRLNNKRRLEEGVGHAQGEHEVIAHHKNNEFHLGFFLFRREEDKSITIREYFMQENEDGERVPMVLERNCPQELVNLEYTENEIEYAGTKFRTSTPESVYAKKLYTKHEKDMLDIQALEPKIDREKIKKMNQYSTRLTIVEPDDTGIRETPKVELSLGQKLAIKLASNKLLKRFSFINNFLEKRLKLLPKETQKKVKTSIEERKRFEDDLSANGEHKVESNRACIIERDNTQIHKDAKEPIDE